jgi:hypothetical protein
VPTATILDVFSSFCFHHFDAEERKMKFKHAALAAGLITATALSITGVMAEEKPSGHPGTPETEMRYKGAPVPIKPERGADRGDAQGAAADRG